MAPRKKTRTSDLTAEQIEAMHAHYRQHCRASRKYGFDPLTEDQFFEDYEAHGFGVHSEPWSPDEISNDFVKTDYGEQYRTPLGERKGYDRNPKNRN